jgi:DeoR family suf operon transcriptional repressor
MLALCRLGSATAEELAAHCFLSVGAASQHLQSLKAQGFIDHEPERHGPGRPRHRYRLTARGQALFPKLDHEALVALLDAIDEEPADLRDRLLRRIEQLTIERYRATFEREGRGSPIRGALAVFAEAGFLAEVEERPGGFALTLHHCPIAEVARGNALICEAEERSLAATFPGMTLRRVAFRPDGDPHCAYLISSGSG